MFKFPLPVLAGMSLLLSGCVASAVVDIATLPVKAGSKAVDVATTSRAESDRNYGRKMRKREAREGKERRKHEKACRRAPANCGPYQGYRARPGD
ncbi:MAG: hypothetical protein WDN24_10165 [Sphingomonas sp.]